MQTIHFKVAANNSFRRFSLANPSLEALKTQVASLFGIDSLQGWTIRYKDEENHLVSIDSDEELSYAAQLIGGKVLSLFISFPGSLGERAWNKYHHHPHHHGKSRPENKEHLAWRLQKKQERMRERLAPLESSDNPRAKVQASKLEAEIAAIGTELESLNIQDVKGNSSAAQSVVNCSQLNERKVRCNKISCLKRKQDRIREKLLKISSDPEKAEKKQAKVSKLNDKLSAISAKLEVIEKDTAVASSASSSSLSANSEQKENLTANQPSQPVSENSTDKQLVEEVKSKFISMRRELHQDRMNIISLGKVLGALRVVAARSAISNASHEQLAQTEISLKIAEDEFAAKKILIQQQKELLCNLSQQLGIRWMDKKDWKDRKNKKDWKDKMDKMDKKDWKELKHDDKKSWKKNKEEQEKRVKQGRVEKTDRKKSEKKFRKDEKKYGRKWSGQSERRCPRMEHEESSESSSFE